MIFNSYFIVIERALFFKVVRNLIIKITLLSSLKSLTMAITVSECKKIVTFFKALMKKVFLQKNIKSNSFTKKQVRIYNFCFI